ncbi:MAG: twin-arginine translocation signal domain-containing protein, partial [bacterium]
MNRRHFLKTAGAVTLGFAGLRSFIACKETRDVGYGPLLSDPQKIFDLPKGFSYQVISRHGQQMS